MQLLKTIKGSTPYFIQRWLHSMGIYKDFTPAIGKFKAGDFERTTPLSICFGYDRGGPVDRYYIEQFLDRQSSYIKGRVLEIGDNEYTLQFGKGAVTQSDILHVNKNNPKATIIGDLGNADHVPGDAFDCIILTQTLHLIYNFKDALQTCYRILKPGGALLLTVPGISHIDQGEWKETWMWSFTSNSIKRALSETFSPEKLEVETFGNVFVATAFLYGLGLPELKKKDLDTKDDHYQLIITTRAIK